MDKMEHERRSGRVAADPRARDSHGRWVRRDSPTDPSGITEFVFDDAVLEASSPPGSSEDPLYLNDRTSSGGSGRSRSDGAGSAAVTGRLNPIAALPPMSSRISPAIWFLGVGVLLAGILLAALQHENIGPGPFAQWISPDASATAPGGSPEVPRAMTDPGEQTAPGADRLVVPTIPPAPARRPAAPPAVVSAPAEFPEPGPSSDEPPQGAPAVSPDPTALEPATAPGEQPTEPAAAAEPAAPDGEDQEGWLKLADEYLQVGEVARAEELYRRILERGPQRGPAALALGDLYSARGDYRRAGEYYRESKRLFQQSGRPLPPR